MAKEEISPEEKKLQDTAKKYEKVAKAVSTMHTGLVAETLNAASKKDADGEFAGLNEKVDQKKLAEKLNGYMQKLFYTSIVGMKPEAWKEIKEKYFGTGVDVNGNKLGDVLGAHNKLPGKASLSQLLGALFKEGVQGLEAATGKVMEEFGGETLGRVVGAITPETKPQADAVRKVVKQYNPEAKGMDLENIVAPERLAQLYGATIPYMLKQSKN